jgi:hypothetical protein
MRREASNPVEQGRKAEDVKARELESGYVFLTSRDNSVAQILVDELCVFWGQSKMLREDLATEKTS